MSKREVVQVSSSSEVTTIDQWLKLNESQLQTSRPPLAPPQTGYIAPRSVKYVPKGAFKMMWLGNEITCVIMWAREKVVDHAQVEILKQAHQLEIDQIEALRKKRRCSKEKARELYYKSNTPCQYDPDGEQPMTEGAPVFQIDEPVLCMCDPRIDVASMIELQWKDPSGYSNRRSAHNWNTYKGDGGDQQGASSYRQQGDNKGNHSSSSYGSNGSGGFNRTTDGTSFQRRDTRRY